MFVTPIGFHGRSQRLGLTCRYMPFRGELYFITPISNLASILERGILCNKAVVVVEHKSFAMEQVQNRRDTVVIPNGLELHEYANLYIDARNPAMFSIHAKAKHLCVLVISDAVLQLPNVVVSDMNAASPIARFLPASRIHELNFERIYEERWTHPNDPDNYYSHKREKCAEVLVPEKVDSKHIQKVLVVSADVVDRISAAGVPREKICIHPHTFFA